LVSRLGLSTGIERVVKGRAFLVMKDNVKRMWSITGSRTSAQGDRNAYEKI